MGCDAGSASLLAGTRSTHTCRHTRVLAHMRIHTHTHLHEDPTHARRCTLTSKGS